MKRTALIAFSLALAAGVACDICGPGRLVTVEVPNPQAAVIEFSGRFGKHEQWGSTTCGRYRPFPWLGIHRRAGRRMAFPAALRSRLSASRSSFDTNATSPSSSFSDR
ncbi:MAG: hypothetical protein JSU73_14340 [candidate division WOR-3 bacterium]|nr:MAG: hypothetical protein JSU73_14340 [candidate division WOR-3 bacterium]